MACVSRGVLGVLFTPGFRLSQGPSMLSGMVSFGVFFLPRGCKFIKALNELSHECRVSVLASFLEQMKFCSISISFRMSTRGCQLLAPSGSAD